MALLISLKNKALSPASNLVQCFRAIELWANSSTWQTPTLDANWSDDATWEPTQFTVDPFGWVVLRGRLVYTGTLPFGGTNIFTLPRLYAPAYNVFYGSSIGSAQGIIVFPSGIVQAYNGGSAMTNPNVQLTGVRFTTW